jgi:hypothetical protein
MESISGVKYTSADGEHRRKYPASRRMNFDRAHDGITKTSASPMAGTPWLAFAGHTPMPNKAVRDNTSIQSPTCA